MKRFLVFVGATHYPAGGWNDFHSAHEYLYQAIAAGEKGAQELIATGLVNWWHVVDSETGDYLSSGEY